MTFDLQDLDDEFWEKVVFFQIYHSSGLGGPGALFLVTEDRKKYYLGFEDLPFNEFSLAENLNDMFEKSAEWDNLRRPYVIEDKGWIFLRGLDIAIDGEALIRGDIYEAFREVALNKELVEEKVFYGYHNLPDIVGLSLGIESLERVDYIRSVKAQEKYYKLMTELDAEHERKKLLPEHMVWKPMHVNNEANNTIMGEYALVVNKIDDKITARKFTIVYQPHMIEPMHLDPSKGTEYYVLFEKSYDEVYGPIEYPTSENKWVYRGENYQSALQEFAYIQWTSFRDGDMYDYGNFIRCFKTEDEAKEYALCFANANGGDRFTLITNLDPKEDQKRRVERFEAYRAYQKYYKKIMDVIVNADIYPDNTSGGGAYLIGAILEGVPEITEKQLMYIRHDLPWVLEKRTQATIEKELQRSLDIIKKMEGDNDMATVTFVMGATASGKTYYIKNNFADKDVDIHNIYDYQQRAYDEAGFGDRIPIGASFRCLLKANEMHLEAIIESVKAGRDVVVEQTFFKAKRRISYIDKIREISDVRLEIYVMCPSDERWQKNIDERELDRSLENLKKDQNEIEFPNPAEGFDAIYRVTDGDITLQMDPPDEEIVIRSRKELAVEKEEVQVEDEENRKRKELRKSMNTRPFWHYCEVCGKKEFITAKEAFDKGWDYPPNIGRFGMLSPRTCGDCGIQDTLFFKVNDPENGALPIVVESLLTDEEKITWNRIKGEPESLLE